MSYSVQNIRNVCLLGHSGSGKTALAESLLYITGAIDRMGPVSYTHLDVYKRQLLPVPTMCAKP